MFEVYLKIIFDMKNIYDNDVNNIDELSLLYDILNLSKLKKNLITLLSYMGLLIHVEIEKNIKFNILDGTFTYKIAMINKSFVKTKKK